MDYLANAFLKNGDTYTSLDVNMNIQSEDSDPYNMFFYDSSARGINNRGQVVGGYDMNWGAQEPFLKDGSTYTRIRLPVYSDGQYWVPLGWANDINNRGKIVGDTAFCGWLKDRETYTKINYPAFGINNWGHIVGSTSHQGFVLDESTYTFFNYPGATSTRAYDINNRRQIIGYYSDETGVHAFLATYHTPLPPTVWLLGSGLLGLVGWRRFKS